MHRKLTSITTSIYRKPTFTDSIIRYTSNHPAQHRYAAVRFLFNRLNSYNLDSEEYLHELNIIHNILYNNASQIKPQKTPTNKLTTASPLRETQKWTSFTYVGNETSYITNIFRKTDLRITFRTNNTIGILLSCKNHTPDKYSLSGVYKLTCPDCHKAYIGQTGRRFAARFKEHEAAFRNNSHSNSNFAKHLIEGHSFGPIHNIMRVLHYYRKGAHLNTLERFHIHAEATTNNHLTDNHTTFPNAIFDTLAKNKYSHKKPTPPPTNIQNTRSPSPLGIRPPRLNPYLSRLR